jgi:hypothetical protein
VLSGKWWFKLAVTTPSFNERLAVVAFLGDPPAVVKGRTGVAQHGEASWLSGWAREAAE